jgi:long-chain acyl-CoA synthetase
MKGYLAQRRADRADRRSNGWLHTGDVGHLDEAGRIVITDRKKDLIILDKGDNVAPQGVEGM